MSRRGTGFVISTDQLGTAGNSWDIMAAREDDIVAGEMEDEAGDQTEQTSTGQEDTPEESNIQQDNIGHNPPAMANASPANAESSNEESPPVDRNDMPSNGNNSNRARKILQYVAVGVTVGSAAVAATPWVLGAAGFTATGISAGSFAAFIQSAVYGGSVASGSVFALLQSAGAAGIGTTSGAAIGGITGGTAALGNYMFDRREAGVTDSSDSCGEADHGSVVDEGAGGSAREEIADFEGDVVGVGVGADEDDISNSVGEADRSSVVDEGVGGSAREEIADFEGDVVAVGVRSEGPVVGVSVGVEAHENDSSKRFGEADHSSVVDEGAGASAREEIADFEGDVAGVSVRSEGPGVGEGADEDDSSDNCGEADHSSVVDEGAGGSAREEIADFEGDVAGVGVRSEGPGVGVGADEDDSSDNCGEADHSSVVDEGAGSSAREGIADFEGDVVVVSVRSEAPGVGNSVAVEFQEENEEPKRISKT